MGGTQPPAGCEVNIVDLPLTWLTMGEPKSPRGETRSRQSRPRANAAVSRVLNISDVQPWANRSPPPWRDAKSTESTAR